MRERANNRYKYRRGRWVNPWHGPDWVSLATWRDRTVTRPMKRRRVQASLIWEHGDEYSKANREGEGTSWLCDYCDVVMTLSRSQTTSNILRHLREEHRVTLSEPINRREERASRGTSSNSAISRSSSASRERTVSSLLSFTYRVDIVEFQNLLLR